MDSGASSIEANEQRAFSQLMQTIRFLRSEQGCPWDRQQTCSSLRSALIEECWELVAAIEEKSPEGVAEELGDSLLVLLLMSLSQQRPLSDILQQLVDKLISRHPHVFDSNSAKATDAQQALNSWHNAKFSQVERLLLDSIPNSLAALERAYKMQTRAARVGFDWHSANDIVSKVNEELDEWRLASEQGDRQAEEEELGDLLFSVINLIRFQGFDPALALQRCNRKFYQRFCYIEKQMRQQGQRLDAQSKDKQQQLEQYWQQAKAAFSKE